MKEINNTHCEEILTNLYQCVINIHTHLIIYYSIYYVWYSVCMSVCVCVCVLVCVFVFVYYCAAQQVCKHNLKFHKH